jgi:curved DNA-binding protein CbpA
MALSFASEREGELGRVFASELLATAMQTAMTGELRLQSDGRSLHVFFNQGKPVTTSGDLAPDDRMGDILVERGVLRQSELKRGLEAQSQATARPLLGAVLVRDASLDPDEVKRAVQEQVLRRLRAAIPLTEGSWSVFPGERGPTKEIGVAADLTTFLLTEFPGLVSSAEVRDVADRLLGKAVRLREGGAGALAQTAQAGTAALLKYLERPRKPDQLERATGARRATRIVLRQLELLGRLETLPIGRAIPIPSATLLKGQAFSFTAPADPDPPRAATAAPPDSDDDGAAPPPPVVDADAKQLIRSIRQLHAKLGQQNHFEVLGVTERSDAKLLREQYRTLAKRYHPDSLPKTVGDDVAQMARDVAARINEAYTTLSNDRSRAEYEALLADRRIQGDARRAELVRDAEVKAQMGVVMLRKRNFAKAREYFRYATEADPVTPLYKAQLAYAMHADARFDRKEAFEKGYPLLLDALKALGDKNGQVHYWMGLMLKDQDRLKEALAHFKKAHRIDKNDTDAGREVRLVEGRLAKLADEAKKGTGSLSRFFKR